MKRSLRKFSLTLRHIGHTRTNNGFSNLWKHCYADSLMLLFTKDKCTWLAAQHVTVSLHYLPRCVRSTVSCNKTPVTVI